MAIVLGKIVSVTVPFFTANIDLGNKPISSGNFTLSGTFNIGLPVIITQTASSTGESECDIINVVGYVSAASTIQCYWTSSTMVSGIKNFTYRQV